MKSSFALVLPALATCMATAIAPRQAPEVRVLSARAISPGQGSGCPEGSYSVSLNEQANILTIIFDKYRVEIGPGEPSEANNRFCDFEVTFSFPVGCTKGTIHNSPGGLIRLENRFEASFSSTYILEGGQITRSPGEIRYDSTNYGAPEGSFRDFKSDHATDIEITVNTENNRNVIYRANTRIFLSSPGLTPLEKSTYDLQNTDIYIENVRAC
jgi:hypothetical protein